MAGIICGTGSYIPEYTMDNNDIARLVETSDEWIRERTGVVKRHIIRDETTVSMASEAGRKALENGGVSPEEVDLILVATISSNVVLPGTACLVQKELGAVNAVCFDIGGAACTGFVLAYNTAEAYLESGIYRTALVIGSESLSCITNWKDRGTCILFGDGAAGVVVECREDWPSIGAVLGSHGTDQMLRVPGVETDAPSLIYMEGTKVFKFAIEAVPWCIDQVLQRHGKTIEDVDFFVFHQANARIIDLVVRKYQIPLEKYYKNIQEYGNTSAASIPLVLSDLWDQGKIGAGSRLLIVGFGGGLTWGGAYVEFE